ncbi:MAG: 3-hydroxyacyl-CoA dehydrogenase family protein [Oscillospiraceae bacterium]|jgi:3-hydroxybutyryl-CoA dehydrogenase
MKKFEDVNKIAVLGAGTMGPGIAQCFATGGYNVALWTRSEATREKARVTLHKNLETFAEEGVIDHKDIEAIFGRVEFPLTVSQAVKNAELVMETIVENADAKKELYAELDGMLPEDTIIASNTSFLNIFEIMPERRLPCTVIAHWYSPPQLIPLVEVVKNEKTYPEYADIALKLLEKCGKTAVPMKKFIRGYIVNRMQMCMNQELFYLLDNDYCTPEDLDKAVKASIIPRAMVLGLCQRADFGGLDMTANNYRNKSYQLPPENPMPKTLAEHVEKGELGFKTGKGFYDYSGKDKQEILRKRDKQLFEAFKLAKKLMEDPLV